jgi:hypothetical protein
MARAWFEPFHPAYAFSWQALHFSLPTCCASASGAVRGGRSDRTARYSGTERTTAAVAATPAIR